jgi:ATP-dependent RNA helicase RhlE
VASDGAGRSLDLSGISHVVNYHVPQTPEDYAHRLGRPGRPDAPGDMFTLMSTDEQKDIAGIERLLGRTIERSFLPSFDYGMRPSEIRQVLNYDDEWTRPRRTAGVQATAARIASGAAARVPATPHMPAPPAPPIPRPLPGMPATPAARHPVPAAPKKPVATPGRPWLSPPKPLPAKKSAAAKKPAAKRPAPPTHPAKAGHPPRAGQAHAHVARKGRPAVRRGK